MDKAAFAHQGVSGQQRERLEDANLDCALLIGVDRYCKKCLCLEHPSLNGILQILSHTMFE